MGEVFSKIGPTLPLDAPIGKTPRNFATDIVRAALSQTQINLIRMMSMESKRFPELGHSFYELGAGRGKAALANYFTEQNKPGLTSAKLSAAKSRTHGTWIKGSLSSMVEFWNRFGSDPRLQLCIPGLLTLPTHCGSANA